MQVFLLAVWIALLIVIPLVGFLVPGGEALHRWALVVVAEVAVLVGFLAFLQAAFPEARRVIIRERRLISALRAGAGSLLIALIIASGFVAVVGIARLMLPTSTLSQSRFLTTAGQVADSLTPFVVVLLTACLGIAWLRVRDKLGKLRVVARVMNHAAETLATLRNESTSVGRCNLIRSELDFVIEQLLENSGKPLLRQNGTRAGWIFLAANSSFACVHSWPRLGEYSDLRVKLRPNMWNPSEMARLRDEEAGARRFDRKKRREEEARVRAAETRYSSVTGHAFHCGGTYLVQDLLENHYYHGKHLEYLDESLHSSHSFRSALLGRLQVGDKKLGEVSLTDSRTGGFERADRSLLLALLPIVAALVLYGVEIGCLQKEG